MPKAKESKYKDWGEIDDAMRRMGEIDIALEKAEGEMTMRINAIRDECDVRTAAIRAEHKQIKEGIEAYVEEHADEFAATRSKELTFGSIACRVSSSIRIIKTAACVAALKALGRRECLRVKEEPDKDAMDALDDITLARVSAKRVVTNNVRIEPNREKIAAAA